MKKFEFQKEKIADYCRRWKIIEFALFGSALREDFSQESDIDVLVEFEDNANLIDYVGLSLFIEEKLKQRVDIVPESAIRKEIKSTILREATYI